ncbi:MAG: peptide/nickel transport system substrate-binding protein [Thermomicrobiales bacterium]|nr:peptide/nickel transport system substrate-binding protein [Thermomicrobiales bacterium]
MTQSEGSLSLLNDVLRGRCSRRDLLTRAAALGIGTSAIATMVGLHDRAVQAQTPDTEPTGAITWAIESDPVNLIPFGATATSNMWGKEFMYDSLLEWDKDLNILPALAESYEAAADATSYTFKLRQGVKFHDGKEMTSADVKYSIETAISPPEPGIAYPFLANIASVEAVDPYTVKINMSKSDPAIPGVLAWQRYTPIVPENSAGPMENWLSKGIGTGPFQLVEFNPNDSVVYTAFADHWKQGSPCIKDLTLKVLPDEQSRVSGLRAGEIDGATISADVRLTLENDDEMEILSGLFAAPRVIQISTVTADTPWRDTRVRQAINKVVDRQEIIDKVYGGEAELTGAISPGYGDWPLTSDELAEFYKVDLEGAKALMAEAGFADGFSVTLQAISAPRDYTQIAEIVREQVAQLNIKVEVQPLEIGTFAKNIGDGSYEWASTGRGMRGDPSGFVLDFRSGTANNVKWFGDGWKNDELDQAYDAALATADVAQRHELYRRIQQIIAQEAAHIYTVQPRKFQVVRKRVSGMYVAYTDFNTGLRQACVSE